MELQEQNILIENKYFQILFSIDYINHKFLVDIYSKEEETTIISDFEITRLSVQKTIMNVIDNTPGTIYRKGNTKYLIRNHDRTIDHKDKTGTHFSYDKNSETSIYDTRNEKPTITKLPLYIKEAWLKI